MPRAGSDRTHNTRQHMQCNIVVIHHKAPLNVSRVLCAQYQVLVALCHCYQERRARAPVYVYMYVCIYICMYVCIYICMYVYLYICMQIIYYSSYCCKVARLHCHTVAPPPHPRILAMTSQCREVTSQCREVTSSCQHLKVAWRRSANQRP